MRADMSSKPVDEIPELAIPKKVLEYIRARHPVPRSNIQTIEDYFIENGPNGSHFCLVSHFAGPSILSMSDSPGRVIGSRRLRRDLARKVAKQLTGAVELIHSAGFVHGDLTTSNILFRVAENVQNWSDSDVYINFGQPVTEEVVSRDHSPLGPSSPARLFAPIDNSHLTNSTFLQEDTLLIDFGQSFPSLHPPSDYEPATVPHYQSPEARFEGRIDMSSDIWALACTIFEIRAGFPLFEAFLGGPDEILKEVVATLGKLPEPWWGAFENHHLWFDEDGMPKGREFQQVLLPAEKTSIKHKLTSIGSQDLPPATGHDGPMMERPGTRLDEVEIQLLGNLLEKMLRYLRTSLHRLTSSEKEKIGRRVAKTKKNRRKRLISCEAAEAGPSEPKGKEVDPRNWGSAGLTESDVDVEAQAAALKSIQQQKLKAKKLAREIPPHVETITHENENAQIRPVRRAVEQRAKRTRPDASRPVAQIAPKSYLGVALEQVRQTSKSKSRRRLKHSPSPSSSSRDSSSDSESTSSDSSSSESSDSSSSSSSSSSDSSQLSGTTGNSNRSRSHSRRR
ncbi:hypothetical protein H0H81_001274, partial [Sphagnurus paluster]